VADIFLMGIKLNMTDCLITALITPEQVSAIAGSKANNK
jgi:hypothetical protein